MERVSILIVKVTEVISYRVEIEMQVHFNLINRINYFHRKDNLHLSTGFQTLRKQERFSFTTIVPAQSRVTALYESSHRVVE